MIESIPNEIQLRPPYCSCGSNTGWIETRGGQDCVFCSGCRKFKYNAPKTETGRAVRSTQTVHAAIKPKTRLVVIFRANGHCELCGKCSDKCEMHVGHVISVKAGIAAGMTDAEINDEENLIACCDECNLGMGDEPIPLRFMLKVITARLRRKTNAE